MMATSNRLWKWSIGNRCMAPLLYTLSPFCHKCYQALAIEYLNISVSSSMEKIAEKSAEYCSSLTKELVLRLLEGCPALLVDPDAEQ